MARVKSVRALIDTYHFMRQEPDIVREIPVPGDFSKWWNFSAFRRWFHECLNKKINRGDPRQGWRKMDGEYQLNLRRDARAVNDYYGRRLRHSGSRGLLRLPEMQAKYPHINNQP